MPRPTLDATLRWRAGVPYDDKLRRRVEAEVRAIAWSLSQLQALVHEAHAMTGLQHAYLLPRMEVRLPIYDEGLRLRVIITLLERPGVGLFDGEGRKVADVVLP